MTSPVSQSTSDLARVLGRSPSTSAAPAANASAASAAPASASSGATAATTMAAPAMGLSATSGSTHQCSSSQPYSGGSGGSGGNMDMSQMMSSILSLMTMFLQMMMQMLGGQAQAMDVAAPTAANSADEAALAQRRQEVLGSQAPIPDDQTSQALDRLIVGGTPEQRAQLKQSLYAISKDEDGKKLIDEAIRNGTTFEAGDPATAAGGGPNDDVRGVTISKDGKSHIVVRDPMNIKTLAHELVHAGTTENDNSQDEEGVANIIGKRVESRILGTDLEDPNATYNNTLPNYQGLARSNNGENIRDSLARLGITV